MGLAQIGFVTTEQHVLGLESLLATLSLCRMEVRELGKITPSS